MMEAGLILVGVLVGGAVAWMLATARARGRATAEQGELQQRAAAIGSSLTEVRSQLGQREAAVEALRLQLQAEQQARVAADTRVEEVRKNVDEQKKLLDTAQLKLKEAFTALSADALRSNSEAFVKQAAEKVKPLSDALERYEKHTRELEKIRQGDYGRLTEQLKMIGSAHRELSRETSSLTHALRAPQVKGRWGELTLRRALETAGLSPHYDFVEQVSVDTDDGKQRPDVIVTLPGNRTIVVDSKAPTTAYLDALEADNEDDRQRHLARHAQTVRNHMRGLSAKAYWSQFDNTPEFVVMFIPGESFFSAALEQDHGLIEEGIRNRVILASPTTLIALLQAVAYSWKQQDLVENARQIGEQAKELFERACVFADHMAGVGSSLTKAVRDYNAAVGSWESRVLPAGRRIRELGVSTRQDQFTELDPVDTITRTLGDTSLTDTDETSSS